MTEGPPGPPVQILMGFNMCKEKLGARGRGMGLVVETAAACRAL